MPIKRIMMGDGKIFQDRLLKMAWAGVFVGILFWPSAAWANVGTTLMWASCFYLVVGNALIGVLEGLLIGLVFKAGKGKAILWMILANYLSAWLGWIVLEIIQAKASWFNGGFERVDIYNGEKVIIGCLIASIILTLIIEGPFCFLALGKKSNRWRLSVWALLLSQSISYVLLFSLGSSVCTVSLYQQTEPDASLQYEGNGEAVVYYLGLGDKALHRISLDDFVDEKLGETDIQNNLAVLFIRKAEDAEHWDLWAAIERDEEKLLQRNVSGLDGTSWGPSRWNIEDIDWYFFYGPYDLREVEERDWEVSVDFRFIEGIRLMNEQNDEQFRIALVTPFLKWFINNVWILPGDYVVFQMGDQIVLLDIEGRKMRLLARGMGSAVVLRE